MKAGHIFRIFTLKDGRKVTLRAFLWEDLDSLVKFINSLVEERSIESDLGIIADKRQTREEEAEYLARQLIGMETGRVISVVAEVGGRVVGNSDVTRGGYSDTWDHGSLGIAITRKYRGLGIGAEMMKTLVRESRKAGLKTIQLEVFAGNTLAIHLYEKVGFKQAGRIPKKIHRGGRFFDIVVMAARL